MKIRGSWRHLRLGKGSGCDWFTALNSLHFWDFLRNRAMRNCYFFLLCSALAEKATLSKLVMEFHWNLSTWCQDIRPLHSWTSAVWVRGNLPTVWPLCMKPLLHKTSSAPLGENHVLNITVANTKAKVFLSFITPYSTLLLQWIRGNNPRVKHLQVDMMKPRTTLYWLR